MTTKIATKKFVGVPTKLLALIISTLLLLAVGFSTFSFWRLQADYRYFQQESIVISIQQFTLIRLPLAEN